MNPPPPPISYPADPRPSAAPNPAAAAPAPPASSAPGLPYTINARALQRWSRDRVTLSHLPNGTVRACFRYDGTTCSNMGRPLSFIYEVELCPGDDYRITSATCRPSPGDEGHRLMCAYLSNQENLLAEISTEKPLLGQPLVHVLQWPRPADPAGCYCHRHSRLHKWGLALETIHFALSINATPSPSLPVPS